MEVTEVQAVSLCDKVIDLLSKWPARYAAVQGGGLEEKSTHHVGSALEGWLVENNLRLHVMREYRKIDFALITPTWDQSRLAVDTVIEVKFNYAVQSTEIVNRVPLALAQASRYRAKVSADDAYVLYLIAAPQSPSIPRPVRDSGWEYWELGGAEKTLAAAVENLAAAAGKASSKVLGQAKRDLDPHCGFYCALIAVQ